MPRTAYGELQGLRSQNYALKWAGWLFFCFALFPALSLIPLPVQTDTQPNALLVAALVFLVGRRVPLPLPVWTLLVLLTGAFLLFVAGAATMDGLRSLLGYATVFIIAAATLVLAATDIRLSDRLLDYSLYIWTFVGTVQYFVWRPFMTFLVTDSRTTETRGVTSLSNEPSIYATTIIFFMILYFIRGRERSFPVFLCIVQIILFSQSALGVLFLMMMLGLYAILCSTRPVAITGVVMLSTISFVLYMYGGVLFAGTRIGGLLTVLKNSPLLLLKLDQSVSNRVASIFYSLKGAVENVLMPHGFDVWKAYAYSQGTMYKDIFGTDFPAGRILSGYGTALFEIGWVGLTIPILITVGIVKSMWRDNPSRAICLLVVAHLLLLMPIPLAFPLIGLLIGELLSGQPSPNPKQAALFAKPDLTALESH